MWLESIGVVSGCFPHITYISLLHLYLFFFAAASLLLFSFCYIYIESVEKIYKYEEKLTTHMPTRFSCSTVAFYLVHSCMYIKKNKKKKHVSFK